MDAKLVTTLIVVGILLFVGIWTVSLISGTVTLPGFTQFNESIAFNAISLHLSGIPVKRMNMFWVSLYSAIVCCLKTLRRARYPSRSE